MSARPKSYGRSLREVAKELGVSHAAIIIIERRALAKLLVGLGLFEPHELPARIRKHLPRNWLAR